MLMPQANARQFCYVLEISRRVSRPASDRRHCKGVNNILNPQLNDSISTLRLGNAEFTLFDNLGEKIGVKYPIPPLEMFAIPWSESWASRFLRHSENGTVNRILNESGLILTPSSGERFDLHIAAFDQFLRRVNSSVGYISVSLYLYLFFF